MGYFYRFSNLRSPKGWMCVSASGKSSGLFEAVKFMCISTGGNSLLGAHLTRFPRANTAVALFQMLRVLFVLLSPRNNLLFPCSENVCSSLTSQKRFLFLSNPPDSILLRKYYHSFSVILSLPKCDNLITQIVLPNKAVCRE